MPAMADPMSGPSLAESGKKTGAFLIIYLGKLPGYFDFWARSCEPNQDRFHWYVYNDCIEQKFAFNKAVTLVPYCFEQLCQDLDAVLGIRIPPGHTWLVCDTRLLLYALRKHKEPLDRYDFIGYSDLDVVYGDIHRYLPERPLNYALISGANERPCGPFTLFNRRYLTKILKHPDIKAFFETVYPALSTNGRDCPDPEPRFSPISGNTVKDSLSARLNFTHLDESTTLVRLAQA